MAKDETPIPKNQNYGSVSLRLAANWSRDAYKNSDDVDTYVGHENGIADVHLKNDPDKEHDFGWSNKKTEKHMNLMRKRGFRPLIVSQGWVVRDGLMERGIWRLDGDMIMRDGDFLMVRDAELWHREEAAKKHKQENLDNESSNALAEMAAKVGANVGGAYGGALRMGTRQRL